MLRELSCRIVGVAPLLMHSGQTADPLNKFAKALKAISGKRKKTDEDYEEMAKIEWNAGLYVNGDGAAIIPSEVMESCLVEGAKKSKLGKQFKSAVFVECDAILEIGTKKRAIDLWGDDNYRDTRGVKVGQARVMRTRPIFKEWAFDLTVTYDDEQVNESEVQRALVDAGSNVGLCDFRPKFGRFEVEFK